jgi:hypothetical protein
MLLVTCASCRRDLWVIRGELTDADRATLESSSDPWTVAQPDEEIGGPGAWLVFCPNADPDCGAAQVIRPHAMTHEPEGPEPESPPQSWMA